MRVERGASQILFGLLQGCVKVVVGVSAGVAGW